MALPPSEDDLSHPNTRRSLNIANPQPITRTSAASSSNTASSDHTHSPPVPSSLSSATTRSEGNKSEGEQQQIHHQFRKGKHVSPVWKPQEMLWPARAWRVQYQRGGGPELGGSSVASGRTEHVEGDGQGTRGKTSYRANKDRQVTEFLQRHGVNRYAKTAKTKWDNMLGEFRKVYEWERGGERHHVGKSYFILGSLLTKERFLHFLLPSMKMFSNSSLSSWVPECELPTPKLPPLPPPLSSETIPDEERCRHLHHSKKTNSTVRQRRERYIFI